MPVSSDCNLGCKYCYCHRTPNEKNHRMAEDVMEIIMGKFINAYSDYISFCWHGGEPLLAGIDFYRHVLEIQSRKKKKDQEIENRLQTNATLINKEWACFFKNNDFKVGISIDGPEFLNDNQRLLASGKGSFRKIMNGVDALRSQGINFSVIITVTSETIKYAEQIYQFVVEQEFRSVNLNPCFGVNELRVDFVKYAHFMNEIFDFWFIDDREDISFGHLNDILNGLLGGKASICHIRNSCYRHVKIDYNGDVFPCDSFLGTNFKFGNLITQELSEIINDQNYINFFNESRKVLEECVNCKQYKVCGGGCSRHSFDGNMLKKRNKMCTAKKIMFGHISDAIDKARS